MRETNIISGQKLDKSHSSCQARMTMQSFKQIAFIIATMTCKGIFLFNIVLTKNRLVVNNTKQMTTQHDLS
jgi:DeoR/GlpR family transcriptional regulator of sugar metabolism